MDADWNWTDVCSPFARIYYVTEGEAEIHTDTDVYALLPHHLYLLPPYTWHCNVCRGRFAHYYIHFLPSEEYECLNRQRQPVFQEMASTSDLRLLTRLMQLHPHSELQQTDPSVYDNEQTLNKVVEAYRQASPQRQTETSGILLILMSRFMAADEESALLHQEESWFHRCLAFVQENLGEDLNIAQLADIACMSKDHFIRCFKQKMHTTPLAYILQLKMRRAQHLLLTTDLSVKEIAHRFGIVNPSYFCRLFKSHTGKSPLIYRKLNLR